MADAHVWVDFGQVRTKTILVTYLTQTMERGHTRANDLTALSIGVASLRSEQIVGSGLFFGLATNAVNQCSHHRRQETQYGAARQSTTL